MSKNILIVAHAFPPSGGAGVRRVLKIIKYLDRNGWKITVLAPKRGANFSYAYDPGLQQQIPPFVQVIETFSPESWLMTSQVAAGSGASKSSAKNRKNFTPGGIYRRIYKTIGSFISIPESAITWLPFAVIKGWHVIRKESIDIIFATAPPYSTLLIGSVLKLLTGKPFIAEFRDAWMKGMGIITKKPLQLEIEKRQESWTIHRADRVISVTEGVSSDFASRFPSENNYHKFVTIPNGYDKDDFRFPLDALPRVNNKLNIVYTGTLGGIRTPYYFLKAIRELIKNHPQYKTKLQVTFVGLCSAFVDGRTLSSYISEFDLQENVIVTGFVPREKSLYYQANADILLLIVGCVPEDRAYTYGLSGKIFDYLLAEKPVLTIAEDGPTSELAKAAGVGLVVSHFDQPGIINAIRLAIQHEFPYRPNLEVINRYDFSGLIKQLDEVLLQSIMECQGKNY